MIKKITSYLLVGLFLGFLIINISNNWSTIVSFKWHFKSFSLVLMTVCLLPLYLINATSWHLVTKALGFNLSYGQNIKIWLYSNLGRFVPGAIWQYAGRLYLTHKEGILKSLAATALGVEVIFNLSAGLLTVLVTIIFWGLPIAKTSTLLILLIACFLVFAILLLKNKHLLNKLTELINKLSKNQVKTKEISLPLKWIPILLCSYLLQFVLGGSVLFFLSRTAVDLPFNLYPLFIGLFAAGWLVGYISIFSPGGLGVQELSLAGLLSAYMPFTIATVIAVIYRLLIFTTEIVTVLCVYIFQKSRNKNF